MSDGSAIPGAETKEWLQHVAEQLTTTDDGDDNILWTVFHASRQSASEVHKSISAIYFNC